MNRLFDVSGRVVLVTGESRGIGKMIARGFAENGATVYISSRKAQACDDAARELSDFGSCFALPADLSEESGRDRCPRGDGKPEQRLDTLVNNAGATFGAPLET